MDYIIFLIGVILLAFGGDLLVSGSTMLSNIFKFSSLFVGLVIMSFATSLPELVVSLNAALSGFQEVSVGNVIGSNIANIGFVLSITAFFFPVNIDWSKCKHDFNFLLFITLVFSLVVFYYQKITFFIGILFILFIMIYIYFISKKNRSEDLNKYDESILITKKPIFKSIFHLIIGSLCLYFGSDFLVDSAILIAKEWGVTERVISISIIAVGTSIPELTASIIAGIKNEKQLAFGNIIGSNIFNILAVLGITTLFTDIQIYTEQILQKDIWIMLFFTLSLYILVKFFFKETLGKMAGLILIILYTLYVLFLFDLNILNIC